MYAPFFLLKIKSGLDSDEIVNDFLTHNEVKVQELNTLLKPKDLELLSQVEKLSTCEAKLLNKIKNLNYSENFKNQVINEKEISLINGDQTNRFSLFMINWSNKFVIIALIIISAIALSKQAWA